MTGLRLACIFMAVTWLDSRTMTTMMMMMMMMVVASGRLTAQITRPLACRVRLTPRAAFYNVFAPEGSMVMGSISSS